MALGTRNVPNRGFQYFSGVVVPTITLTTLAAGNQTLTTAVTIGGLIFFPAGGAETLTLPTAAALVAAMPGVGTNGAYEFTIRNTAGGANTATVAAGAGGTTSGTMTIAQNNSKRFLVVFTTVTPGSEAYTIYSLGTVTT